MSNANGARKFNLLPYHGADPILFGMKPEQVRKIFEERPQTNKNYLGETEESFNGVAVRYDPVTNEVAEIAFAPEGVPLVFNGLTIIGQGSVKNPLPFLLEHDTTPLELLGFLIFTTIGIATGGYHDDDPSQRSVTVFRKGHWDEFLGEASPWSTAR